MWADLNDNNKPYFNIEVNVWRYLTEKEKYIMKVVSEFKAT